MAGTRKYTQDEINNMTTAQRSAAWAGADADSQKALHEANVKSYGNTSTYDEKTGIWSQKQYGLDPEYTATLKYDNVSYGPGAARPSVKTDMSRKQDYAGTVQLQPGNRVVYYDDDGYAYKMVNANRNAPGAAQALADLNASGRYTGQQQMLDQYADAVQNASGKDASWLNDRATFLGNTAKQGGYTGNWAAQLLDQIQNGTLTPTAGTAGAALPKSGGNGGSDFYGEFLKGLQNGADYNTLLNLYNQRVAKTAPGGGFEQYADDDAMRYMRSYLENMGGQPYSPGALPQGGTLGQIQDAIAELQNKDYSYGGGRWDSILDQLAREAINFNYDDWTKSDQYRALEDRFGRQGDMTMRDVLGQVSSRTGGLASSYATTAAQQQYNDYMAQLESVARDQWADEKKTLLDNAQMAQGMSEQEYSRWLDAQKLGDNADSAALSALYDLLGYEAGRDDEMYNRSQSEQQNAQNRIYDYLVNGGGSIAGLDADIIRQSGYTTSELNNFVSQYQAAQAAAAQAAAAKTSKVGSPKKSSDQSSGAQDYDGLFLAAQESGHPKSYIANNYKQYGFTSSSGLYDDFQDWDGGADEGGSDASYTGGGQGLANFEHYASAIGAQLQSGNEKNHGGVIKWLDDNWGKMSEPQQDAMQELLDDYGWSYRPNKR